MSTPKSVRGKTTATTSKLAFLKELPGKLRLGKVTNVFFPTDCYLGTVKGGARSKAVSFSPSADPFMATMRFSLKMPHPGLVILALERKVEVKAEPVTETKAPVEAEGRGKFFASVRAAFQRAGSALGSLLQSTPNKKNIDRVKDILETSTDRTKGISEPVRPAANRLTKADGPTLEAIAADGTAVDKFGLKDPLMRVDAIRALRAVRGSSALGFIGRLATTDESGNIRDVALREVAAIAKSDTSEDVTETVIDIAVEVATKETVNDFERIHALTILSRYPDSVRARTTIQDAARNDGDASVRRYAVGVLARTRNPD